MNSRSPFQERAATLQQDPDTAPSSFRNPIVAQDAPDPWMVYHDGYYYLTFTSGKEIWVWKAPSITGIERGTQVKVWSAPAQGPNCCHVWAPELHFVAGRWYIYYAADDGRNEQHRMFVLRSEGADAQGPYTDMGKLCAPSDRWAIDGTLLHGPGEALYFVWSGWPGSSDGQQNLYIAPMDTPWSIAGERVLISQPTEPWERVAMPINEGPTVMQRQGQIHIVYSASGSWTPDYTLGLLTNTTGNVLDPAGWRKRGPLLQRAPGVYGPGHASFVKSPDGSEDWIIYHAKDSAEPGWKGRKARAQRFSWDHTGAPRFELALPAGVELPRPAGERE